MYTKYTDDSSIVSLYTSDQNRTEQNRTEQRIRSTASIQLSTKTDSLCNYCIHIKDAENSRPKKVLRNALSYTKYFESNIGESQ